MADNTPDNLPAAHLKERDRLKDVVIPQYESIGRGGQPALIAFLRPALERADAAITNGDVIDMLRSYAELKEIE